MLKMSEHEFHKGKLKPTNQTPEEFCEQEGVSLASWNDSWEEQVNDTFYEDAVVIENQVFIVEKEIQDPYDNVFEATKNDDGSYDFIVKYYNGGCGFDEAIEYALENL